MISALILFAYLYQKRLNRKSEEIREIESLLKTEELKSAYATIEGQDRERERIADDLHDRMGGQLSTMKIYLDLLEQTELTEKQSELLGSLQKSAEHSITEIRSIAHDLNSSMLKVNGLPKAVEQLCQVIDLSKKVNVNSHVSVLHDLEGKLARDVYQMIQELITNTLKHSEASNLRLELTSVEDEVNLIFEDDGIGFNMSEETDGMGLTSIRTRVERYGGKLTIDSRKNQGATFIIEIPLTNEENNRIDS